MALHPLTGNDILFAKTRMDQHLFNKCSLIKSKLIKKKMANIPSLHYSFQFFHFILFHYRVFANKYLKHLKLETQHLVFSFELDLRNSI